MVLADVERRERRYLGIGAGAHAKITDVNSVTRLWKVKQPRDFLESAGTAAVLGGEQRLGGEDVAFEFMLNALRLTEGFPPTLFAERAGLPLATIESALTQATERGLAERNHEVIRATALGRQFLNDLIALFLPESETVPATGQHKH